MPVDKDFKFYFCGKTLMRVIGRKARTLAYFICIVFCIPAKVSKRTFKYTILKKLI